MNDYAEAEIRRIYVALERDLAWVNADPNARKRFIHWAQDRDLSREQLLHDWNVWLAGYRVGTEF